MQHRVQAVLIVLEFLLCLFDALGHQFLLLLVVQLFYNGLLFLVVVISTLLLLITSFFLVIAVIFIPEGILIIVIFIILVFDISLRVIFSVCVIIFLQIVISTVQNLDLQGVLLLLLLVRTRSEIKQTFTNTIEKRCCQQIRLLLLLLLLLLLIIVVEHIFAASEPEVLLHGLLWICA